MEFNFKTYMHSFESVFIVRAMPDIGRESLIPIHQGRLSRTKFAKVIGGLFDCERPVVIDYYGYLKRSTGFAEYVRRLIGEYKGGQIRAVTATLVFFAAVKMEDVAKSSPELVAHFPLFKGMVLDARGFKNKNKEVKNG